jgi:hypothetical protein
MHQHNKTSSTHYTWRTPWEHSEDWGLYTHRRAELVAVGDDATVGVVSADLAGDHFHRHTDLHRLLAQAGKITLP